MKLNFYFLNFLLLLLHFIILFLNMIYCLPINKLKISQNLLIKNNTKTNFNLMSFLHNIFYNRATAVLLVTLKSDDLYQSNFFKPQQSSKLKKSLNLQIINLNQNNDLKLDDQLSKLPYDNLIIMQNVNISSFLISSPSLSNSNKNQNYKNNSLIFNSLQKNNLENKLINLLYLLNKINHKKNKRKKNKNKKLILNKKKNLIQQFNKNGQSLDNQLYISEVLDNLNLIENSNSGYIRRNQQHIIENNPGLLFAISQGLKLSLSECKRQFKNKRWNCPTNKNLPGPDLFGKILNKACRETAFLSAIHSAGVAYSITKACSNGLIDTCQCDYKHNIILTTNVPGKSLFTNNINTKNMSHLHQDEIALRHGISGIGGNSILDKNQDNQLNLFEYTNDFKWTGCSDNINFAFKKTKELLDYQIKKNNDALSYKNTILIHNYEAGRLAIQENMILLCKCHGLSGTCTMRTCWRRLSSFSKISTFLKERFDDATIYLPPLDITTEKLLELGEIGLNQNYTQKDLIYSEASPDFCTENILQGSKGTKNRQCDLKSNSENNCKLLCCGRGYKKINKRIKTKCNCRFLWCCTVKCDDCKKIVQIYQCL